jgi:hypothetical protein
MSSFSISLPSNGIKVRLLAGPLVVKRSSVPTAITDLQSRRRINMRLHVQGLWAVCLGSSRAGASLRGGHAG